MFTRQSHTDLHVLTLRATLLALTVLFTGAAHALSPKEQLGKLIFFDSNLSEPAGQSCASCHDPSFAFTEPDKFAPTSQGVNTELFGNRNSPSAAYAKFSPAFHFDEAEGLYVGGQFWDGRASSLEDQAKGPFLNPLEMANPDKQTVINKIRRSPYALLFKVVFGFNVFNNTDRAYDRMADAIAAFERTSAFNKFSSRYDAFLARRGSLTRQERRGLELFERADKGNCAACHISQPDSASPKPMLTDFTYDNLGVPRNPDNRFYQMPAEFNPEGEAFIDLGLGAIVGNAAENGKQKVPTLRNIALTAPYMHNGYFNTLRGVVDFYNSRDVKPVCPGNYNEHDAVANGCWPLAEVAENVNHDELGNLGLTDQEVDDIVAFLRTLSDR